MVYEDAEQLYEEVRRDGHKLLDEAFIALFPKSVPLSLETPPKALDHSGKVVAFNTTFFPRVDVVKIPISGPASQLKSTVMQMSKDGTVGYALMGCLKGGSPGAPVTGLQAFLTVVSGVVSLYCIFSSLKRFSWQLTQTDLTTLSSRTPVFSLPSLKEE
jgi:alpha-mannosidase